MTAAEAERIVRDALLSSDEGINGELAFDFLVAELTRYHSALRVSEDRAHQLAEKTGATDWLLAELARKDEALRHLAGVAERAYGKALIEYRREQPDAQPEECWAEFEALGDVAAALGEQP